MCVVSVIDWSGSKEMSNGCAVVSLVLMCFCQCLVWMFVLCSLMARAVFYNFFAVEGVIATYTQSRKEYYYR